MQEIINIYQGESVVGFLHNPTSIEETIKYARTQGINGTFRIEHQLISDYTITTIYIISPADKIIGHVLPYKIAS